MGILQFIREIFSNKPTVEEIHQSEKIAELEQLYVDIKRLRAEGDYYGKYPDCRYTYDHHDKRWVNQGRDGVVGEDGLS
jgi:hypothetical protein